MFRGHWRPAQISSAPAAAAPPTTHALFAKWWTSLIARTEPRAFRSRKFGFQFALYRFGDFLRSSGPFGLVAPAQMRHVSVRLNESLLLCRRVDHFGEPVGQADFDFIEIVPRLDFRGKILPVKNLIF